MTVLRSKQILQDKQTSDPYTITALSLNHKALSDVSCLSYFKNLERLDLSFNNLSSLEGLKSCVNLKWLSVVENKLQSLKGIEGLTKLTVLNAGKNKLTSMDEVSSLVSLRALILNDNEIVSMSRLEQMKEMNTLVLSRNPIREIGDCLAKVKSLTKLSLSHCQLQTISSSLKSCIELKELRLAHNDIKAIPSELARNVKIQNLDLGNNSIASWSDLKVLSSLVNLKNLNLQGNPIAENDKLVNKIKNLVPNLQIFNSRPVDKITTNGTDDRVHRSSLNDGNNENTTTTNDLDKKSKKVERGGVSVIDDSVSERGLKRKKKKTNEPSKHNASAPDEDGTIVEMQLKKKSKAVQTNDVNIIDDAETPFMDLFAAEADGNAKDHAGKQSGEKAIKDVSAMDESITITSKKKKSKSRSKGHSVLLDPSAEFGLGGPSTWDD